MARPAKTEMSRKVLAFAKTHDWSYTLLAQHFGVTRNVIAGIFFRARHPKHMMIASPGNRGRNMIGSGYRKPERWAAQTARNTGA